MKFFRAGSKQSSVFLQLKQISKCRCWAGPALIEQMLADQLNTPPLGGGSATSAICIVIVSCRT